MKHKQFDIGDQKLSTLSNTLIGKNKNNTAKRQNIGRRFFAGRKEVGHEWPVIQGGEDPDPTVRYR